MADDTQAEVVTEEPTTEPVPSSESNETVDAQDQVDKLPEDVSERTREQFNKLKEANKALKDQLEKKAAVEPIFDAMRPKENTGLTQSQLDDVTDIDPATGSKYINEDKLNNLLTQNTLQAKAAVDQVNRFIEQQQTQEAFNAIPQLDPNGTNFDPELHQATRAFILDSMMNPGEYGGKQLTYREAGEKAAKATRAELAKVEQEANAQQTAKEQGSLEATGRSDRRAQTETTEDELRSRVRNNDNEALASLLGD